MGQNTSNASLAGSGTMADIPKRTGTTEDDYRTFVPDDVTADYEPSDFRQAMHEVDERLWLGNVTAAHDLDILQSKNVTHVVTCLGEECTPYKFMMHYFVIDVEDHMRQDMLSVFAAAADFIESALSDSSCSVLVHCAAGVSRSTTIVLAYMIRKYKITAVEAYNRVRAKRKIIFPNEGFQHQLLLWEEHVVHGTPLPSTPTVITPKVLAPHMFATTVAAESTISVAAGDGAGASPALSGSQTDGEMLHKQASL